MEIEQYQFGQDFIGFVNNLCALEEDAAAMLSQHLESLRFKKGEVILIEGSTCKHLYYINSGLVKIGFESKDRTFIMRFFAEGEMFTVLDSYLSQKPSTYEVVALEDTVITRISRTEMDKLRTRFHRMETFFGKLVAMASVNMMDRIGEILEEQASARYENFLKENPGLLQRVSLRDLASYLGITQVSLSRIRAGI
ncbi:CRP-like cAMP-binding protein [Pedobacter sp. W3I1]|uniref:Crp/Fnr family transcriptional regulator n=1 Tax=Pedobacter sp. W3I1 TaxID=3042291 RepID=UPI002787FD05|nr:Crp/Fnr family transcriptional regulator [Pedobacter sp. W3I1]MDQ0638284.1 CRP-like cAMP-binding protein [Pedobacter sp. W3I1]